MNPELIYSNYIDGKFDKSKAIDSLILIIKNDINENNREMSVEILEKFDLTEQGTFKFLENLLISDSNEHIRSVAANIILQKYFKKGLEAIHWALEHESSPKCLEIILLALDKINSDFVNRFLTSELNHIRKEYPKIFNSFYDCVNLPRSNDWLIEIFIKCKILISLGDYLCDFFVRDNEVVEIGIGGLTVKRISDIKVLEHLPELEHLDLRDNTIEEIDFIEKFLKLKYLNLSFNNIKEIKGFHNSKKLVHLDLSNNKISEIKGLESLVNLAYLNLENNLIHELKGIDSLLNLEELNLIDNYLKEVEKPENLKKLWIFEY
ncbi:MAG: leucine-rich repeat domain-containing protein [Candidatus Hodarchaeota archaeon]